MKKLILTLSLCLLFLLLILLFCLFLSNYAVTQVTALEELVNALPTASELKDTADPFFLETVFEQVQQIDAQLKKAGKLLAYFINYEYLSRAYAAVANLSDAVYSTEYADYGMARSSLLEAIETIGHLEKMSAELLF